MIALWLGLASADPGALRSPGEAAAVVGVHERSLGMWQERHGFAVELTDLSAVSLSYGRRRYFGERAWHVRGGIHAGLVVPLVEPGLGVGFGGFVQGGRFGDGGRVALGVAVPAAYGLTSGQLRLPIRFELDAAARFAGEVWAGARLGVGPVVTPGFDTAIAVDPVLMIGARM